MLSMSARDKDLQNTREMLVETISEETKGIKKEDYDDPKLVRSNKTNSRSGSKQRLLMNPTHALSQESETTSKQAKKMGH
jgi:hypothetical protein